LIVFDAPDATCACTRRNRSNTPLQALTLLNDRAYVECARALATRLLREGPSGDAERVCQAFRCCLSRPPSTLEERRLRELVTEQAGSTPAATWTTLARVLLNLDEFITRE
jgi:hypothetical protein